MNIKNDTLTSPVTNRQNVYNVELVYRIKLLRIVFGFSQDELSFLLGYPVNQITHIEQFRKSYHYSLRDLTHLSFIFECPSIRFLPQNRVDTTIMNIQTRQYEDGGSLIHEAWLIKDGGDGELLWKMHEQDSDLSSQFIRLETIEKTTKLIRQLLAGGYFDVPWETFEIFKVCRETVGNRLRPHQLKEVLLSFTTRAAGNYLRIHTNGNHITWGAARECSPK